MDEVVEIYGVPVHLSCRQIDIVDKQSRPPSWIYSWETTIENSRCGDSLTLDTPIFTQARDILLSQARYQIERAALHE